MARFLNGRVQKLSLYATTEEGLSSTTCEVAESGANVVEVEAEAVIGTDDAASTSGATAKDEDAPPPIIAVVTTDDCKKRKNEGKSQITH